MCEIIYLFTVFGRLRWFCVLEGLSDSWQTLTRYSNGNNISTWFLTLYALFVLSNQISNIHDKSFVIECTIDLLKYIDNGKYLKDITCSQNEQVILTSVLQCSQFYMNGHPVTAKITGIHPPPPLFFKITRNVKDRLVTSVPNTSDNPSCSLVIWRLAHIPHNNNWTSYCCTSKTQ